MCERIFAWPQSIDPIVVLVDMDRTSRAAPIANAVLTLQPPNSLLVEEILAAQRTDRTEVNDVTGQFVVAGMPFGDFDLLDAATADHVQFGGAADLPREADATRAHHTAVGEKRDLIADMVLVLSLHFRFV